MEPELNITDAIERQARRDASAPALVADRRELSYGQLDGLIKRSGAWLSRHGIGAGSSVAICIANPVKHMILACALARLGAAQYGFTAAQVSETTLSVIRQARASVLMSDSLDLIVGSLPVLRIGDMTKSARDWPDAEAPSCADPALTCLVATSSGTTGTPKFITISHRVQYLRARHSGPLGYGIGDRFLSLLDVSVFMQKSLCLKVLMVGGTVYFPTMTSAESLIDYCNEVGITHIFALPSMVSKLIPPRPRANMLPRLQAFVMAGSTVTPKMFETAVEVLSPNVIVAYGSNELGTVACADAAMRRRLPAAVGRCLDGVEWQIVDDSGNQLQAGQVGQIRVRTPCMIDGYPGQPELTRHYFKDGWFCPGDLLSASEDGILMFHGRADDMMIFDSLNIYPADIETALLDHPAVAEAVAFPFASAAYQDVPAAAVVLKAEIGEADLIAHCRHKLGRRTPHRIIIVPQLPRNAMGKIMKDQLARQLAQMPSR